MLLILIISLTEISNAWLGSNSNRYNDEKSRAIRDLTNRKALTFSSFWIKPGTNRLSQTNLRVRYLLSLTLKVQTIFFIISTPED